MSKKNFTTGITSQIRGAQEAGGINSLLEQKKAAKRPVGRPKTSTKDPATTSTSEDGTKEGEIRATFILNKELLEKVKAIAYWDRLKHKEVLETALRDAVAKYEKKNGPLKPRPLEKREEERMEIQARLDKAKDKTGRKAETPKY